MQENIEILNNKISKISIDEENDNVVYYMNNGDALRTKLSTIIDNKKKIYKNFRISQKCHELTTSGFKKRKLQKSLNPAIIKGLNDNVEIMEYIRCVKDKSKLPFELEHNTANSTLNFTNRRKMKNIAKKERKLGAKVNIINENIFNKIMKKIENMFGKEYIYENEKKYTSLFSENEVDKKCEDVKQQLIKYYSNMTGNIDNISELESIELKLKTAINWYIDNQKNKKADTNLRIYRKLLENEGKYFYLLKYHETHKQDSKEAILKYKEPLHIKDCELRKLQIRNLLSSGNHEVAENLYKELLNDLGIKLTKREMKMSLKEGINTGNYYVLENRKFYRKRINGNEGILAEIKNIDKVSNQQNKMKKNQCSILEENKINETENKKTEQSKEKIYSKEEITSIMKKWDNFSDKIKFQKGAVIPVVDALISYLKINKDNDIKEYLDKILTDLNKIEPIAMINEKDGRTNKYNVLIMDYLSNLYGNGVKGINGEEIIKKDEKINSYYMYMLNRRISKSAENKSLLGEEKVEKIKNEYFKNSETIEFEYFEEIKKKHNKQVHGIKEKLINEKKYLDAIYELEDNANNDCIKLLTFAEDLKNGISRRNVGIPTNLKKYMEFYEKTIKQIKANELSNPQILDKIKKIEQEGINDKFDNVIVKASKIKTQKEQKKLSGENYLKEKGELVGTENSGKTVKKRNRIKGFTNKIKINNDTKNVNTSSISQNVYVCSDLHGQYELYKDMLSQVKKGEKLYILGDVIDRGPDGIKILEDIIEQGEKIELLVGNHELMMIQSLFMNREKEKNNWYRDSNGGKKTYDDFMKLSSEKQEKVKELLLKSTVHTEININDENLYLVHAKADKNTDKKKETVEEYLIEGREDDLYNCVWARVDNDKNNNISEKWKEEDIGKEKMFTIIGHTPTDDNKIAIHNSYAIIDCGASYYGNGCLLRLNDGKTVYYDNVTRCLEQVKSEEER